MQLSSIYYILNLLISQGDTNILISNSKARQWYIPGGIVGISRGLETDTGADHSQVRCQISYIEEAEQEVVGMKDGEIGSISFTKKSEHREM